MNEEGGEEDEGKRRRRGWRTKRRKMRREREAEAGERLGEGEIEGKWQGDEGIEVGENKEELDGKQRQEMNMEKLKNEKLGK